MSFDSGSITGKLGLDISEFGAGMLQAQSVASLFPAVVADFMVNPLLAVVEAAKEAARAVFEAVSGVGNAAQELGIQAAKAGVSVGYFSRMSEVAKTVNVSAEQLGTAFKFLEKNAVDAVGGNKVAEKSFGDLGISVEFLRDHLNDTEAIFERVHSAINGLATPAERTRRAMEVMGRQGGDIVPLFKLGRDEIQAMGDTAQTLGAVVDEESVKRGESYKRLEVQVGEAFEGIRRAVAEPILQVLADHMGEILPVIEQLSASIRAAIQRGIDFFKTEDGQKAIKGFEELGVAVVEAVRAVASGGDFNGMVATLGEAAHLLAEILLPALQLTKPILLGLSEILKTIFTDLTLLIDKAAGFVSLFGGRLGLDSAGTALAGFGGQTVIHNHFDVGFDAQEASTQIAGKLLPHMQRVGRQVHHLSHEIDGQAKVHRVGKGLGGSKH